MRHMDILTEEQAFAHFRARLAAKHGEDHPGLDDEAQERTRLYLGSCSAEVQAFVASSPPLTETQKCALAALLND